MYICMVGICNVKVRTAFMLCDQHSREAHEAIKKGMSKNE